MGLMSVQRATTLGASNQVCILHIAGYLDGHTYHTFETKLTELVESGHFNIVIDFERLDYISSAGLGALLNAHTRVREHDGDLKIARLNEKTKRLFDMLGFSHVLNVYDTPDAAVDAFAATLGGPNEP